MFKAKTIEEAIEYLGYYFERLDRLWDNGKNEWRAVSGQLTIEGEDVVSAVGKTPLEALKNLIKKLNGYEEFREEKGQE